MNVLLFLISVKMEDASTHLVHTSAFAIKDTD